MKSFFSKWWRFLGVMLPLLWLTGCQQSVTEVEIAKLGSIVELKTGRQFTPSQWVNEVAAAQAHLLVGEKHDRLSHHQAQYWLLTQLQQMRPQGALLLEMLRVDQQPLIDKVAANFAIYRENLTASLNWQASWSWRFYQALVEQPLLQRYALVATNLTQVEIQQLLRGAQALNGEISTQPKIRQSLAALIIRSHQCDCQADDIRIQRMVDVQQFRDRRMAEKLLQSPVPNLLIAGNHHVNRQYGVPKHLADLAPKRPFTTLLLTDSDHRYTEADGDYIWILPKE